LYKKSVGVFVASKIKIQADSGYQGILNLHKNSETPKKKSRKNPLTKLEKLNNKRISKKRILIENINAKVKVFKIFANKYRNRRKKFSLRFSLICGIINYERIF
jgi:hypothetical protein